MSNYPYYVEPPQKPRRWPWIVALSLVVVALVAVAAVVIVAVQPKSVTGDQHTDAACNAVYEALADNQGSPELLTTLPEDERREFVETVVGETQHSAHADVVQAGQGIAATSVGAGSGVFGLLPYVNSLVAMGNACRAHGWSPEAAGLR